MVSTLGLPLALALERDKVLDPQRLRVARRIYRGQEAVAAGAEFIAAAQKNMKIKRDADERAEDSLSQNIVKAAKQRGRARNRGNQG